MVEECYFRYDHWGGPLWRGGVRTMWISCAILSNIIIMQATYVIRIFLVTTLKRWMKFWYLTNMSKILPLLHVINIEYYYWDIYILFLLNLKSSIYFTLAAHLNLDTGQFVSEIFGVHQIKVQWIYSYTHVPNMSFPITESSIVFQ